MQNEEESFSIPDTPIEVEEMIDRVTEKIEQDKENIERKKHAPKQGIPEEALTFEVQNAESLYETHVRQLERLKQARKGKKSA